MIMGFLILLLKMAFLQLIRDITQSKNGDLIIACYNAGVVKHDGKTFKLFNNGLADKRVILVTNGPDGSIWAGTESAGVGF